MEFCSPAYWFRILEIRLNYRLITNRVKGAESSLTQGSQPPPIILSLGQSDRVRLEISPLDYGSQAEAHVHADEPFHAWVFPEPQVPADVEMP